MVAITAVLVIPLLALARTTLSTRSTALFALPFSLRGSSRSGSSAGSGGSRGGGGRARRHRTGGATTIPGSVAFPLTVTVAMAVSLSLTLSITVAVTVGAVFLVPPALPALFATLLSLPLRLVPRRSRTTTLGRPRTASTAATAAGVVQFVGIVEGVSIPLSPRGRAFSPVTSSVLFGDRVVFISM